MKSGFVTECKFVCPMHIEGKQTKMLDFGAEKSLLLQGHARRQVAHAPQNPNSLKGFSKAFLKARRGRGLVGYCTLLGVGILCSCRCPRRSGHDVPVNLQQDKFYNYLSLCEWKSVIPLKVRALRMGYLVYIRL